MRRCAVVCKEHVMEMTFSSYKDVVLCEIESCVCIILDLNLDWIRIVFCGWRVVGLDFDYARWNYFLSTEFFQHKK